MCISGCKVSPVYDSMIAKIIVKGQSRLEAIKRMRRALEELVIEGIKTNAEYMPYFDIPSKFY
nr:hypothetical protein [Lachnobacterium bovis]